MLCKPPEIKHILGQRQPKYAIILKSQAHKNIGPARDQEVIYNLLKYRL